MKRAALSLLLPLLLAAPRLLAAAPPLLDFDRLFARVAVTGAELAPDVKALDGARVRLRGWAVHEPRPEGGLFLTRTPVQRLHPDDEETLPWDAVAVVFREGLELPPVPDRPTVEGTLRLGNRRVGVETVILVLEDAVPAPASAPAAPGR